MPSQTLMIPTAPPGSALARRARVVASQPPTMTVAPTVSVSAPASQARPFAFHLLATVTLFLLAGSSALTPLYATYQAAWGFSPITTTVVFAAYAVAVLAGLLTFGALSDHVGRRPVVLVALAAQIAAMLIFANAGGVAALFVARILQGISTGAAVAAVGAGLLDLDRATGTIANGVGPMLGTATGALVSGLMVAYLPAPTVTVYVALAAVFALQFLGVTLIAETTVPRPGAWASLRPRLRLPATARPALLVAAPALVAAWAQAGFFGALGPGLVRMLTGAPAVVLGGLALALMAGSGAATAYVLRNTPARAVLARGVWAIGLGAALILAGVHLGALAVLIPGTILSGIGFGAAFQGSVRTVLPHASPADRAGTLAVLFVISYLAMGLPAVLAGVFVVHGGGIRATAEGFMVAILALAVLAKVGLALTAPRPRALSYAGDLVARTCPN